MTEKITRESFQGNGLNILTSTQITSLDLSYVQLEREQMKALLEGLMGNKTIQSLHLCYTTFTSADVIKILQGMPSLTDLYLHCRDLNVAEVLQALPPNLKYLSLRGARLGDMSATKTLTGLDIPYCTVTERVFQTLNPHLETLNLNGQTLDHHAVAYLRRTTSLTSLNLSYCTMGDELYKALPVTLTTLNLSNQKSTVPLEKLRHLSALKRLNISFNRVDARHLQTLLDEFKLEVLKLMKSIFVHGNSLDLSRNTTLEYLDLGLCKYLDLAHLFKSLENNMTLKTLRIENHQPYVFNNELKQSLERNTTILNLYGMEHIEPIMVRNRNMACFRARLVVSESLGLPVPAHSLDQVLAKRIQLERQGSPAKRRRLLDADSGSIVMEYVTA